MHQLWFRLALSIVVAFFCCVAAPFAFAAGLFTPEFFGAHVHRSTTATIWKEVGFGAIRLHDANVTWLDIEPSKGSWHWAHLDGIVNGALDARVDILLPLQAPPAWAAADALSQGAYGFGANTPPAHLSDWKTYITSVARRYKGKISAYEIWNEPNLKQFFSGTPEQMADLTKAAFEVIRLEDPAAKIVCSGITGDYGLEWFKRYLARAGAYCDVIAYHFYTRHERPEKMVALIRAVKEGMKLAGLEHKPLWNTETGWLISTGGAVDIASSGFPAATRVLSQSEAVAYVARALLLARSGGVERFYWYSWDHPSMGLSVGRGTGWAPAGRLYAAFAKLFANANMKQCSSKNLLWNCRIRLLTGDVIQALWTEAGTDTFVSPYRGTVLEISSTGHIEATKTIGAGDVLVVTEHPIFVRTPYDR